MDTNFSNVMTRVLVHEGGNVNHPKDPGGATRQGVTQAVYDGYRKSKGLHERHVFKMENAERDEIYRRQYWNAVKADRLPSGIDYVVMDAAVNSGVSRAAKWLQKVLGVKVDGMIGEATIAAANAHPDHDKLIAAMCAARLAFCKALKTWKTFGRGWKARIENVQNVGQAWASGSVGPAPVALGIFGAVGAKADERDIAALPSVANGMAAAGVGGVVLSTINDLQEALNPLAGIIPELDTVIYGLAAAAAITTCAGTLYSLYAKWKRNEATQVLDLPVAA